jgi:Bacterial extracellular solute-binding proteins, family 3
MGTNQKFKNLLNAELSKTPQGLRTVADVVHAAGLSASAVSMVISGQRSLSPDVAERLGEVLCESLADRKRLVKRLLEEGRKPVSDTGVEPSRRVRTKRRESVVERIRRGEGIKVGFIVCEPFVNADGESGFAIDLFGRLAELMQIDVLKREKLQLKELERRLGTAHEFDIIVTNLLPTFRRYNFMAFSRPFPYLGVPLSGLVSKSLEHKLKGKNITFNAEHLLSPPSQELTRQIRGARIMLIRGEAGKEFAEAFFNPGLMGLLERIPSLADDLAPKRLAKDLLSENIDLFIADVSTCRSVLDQPEMRERYAPLRESEDVPILQPLEMGDEKYSQLALYRIAFGLPNGDEEWRRMVDHALECLMSEGIRSLLSLYREYLEREGDSFSPFLISHDDTVSSELGIHFESLFKRERSR